MGDSASVSGEGRSGAGSGIEPNWPRRSASSTAAHPGKADWTACLHVKHDTLLTAPATYSGVLC